MIEHKRHLPSFGGNINQDLSVVHESQQNPTSNRDSCSYKASDNTIRQSQLFAFTNQSQQISEIRPLATSQNSSLMQQTSQKNNIATQVLQSTKSKKKYESLFSKVQRINNTTMGNATQDSIGQTSSHTQPLSSSLNSLPVASHT